MNNKIIFEYKTQLSKKLRDKLKTEDINKICERYENLYLSTDIYIFQSNINTHAINLLEYTEEIILDYPIINEDDIDIIFDIIDNYLLKAKILILHEQKKLRNNYLKNMKSFFKIFSWILLLVFKFIDFINRNK